MWIHRPCFLVVLKVGRICGNSGCLTFKRIIHCSSGSDIIWNNLVPFKQGVILLLIKITWFSFEKRNHSRVRHCNFYNSLKSHNLNVSHIIFLNCKGTINCLNGPHSSCLVFIKLSSSYIGFSNTSNASCDCIKTEINRSITINYSYKG